MAIKIEDYRGFEIQFQPESERFSYSTDTGSWHQKQSYKACKTSIDEYLKTNATFTPFKIRHRDSGQILTVTGIRKDNRFVTENNRGVKDQMSDYNEKDYILFDESDEQYYAEIALIELEIDALRKRKNEWKDKISNTTLRDVKNKYTVQ